MLDEDKLFVVSDKTTVPVETWEGLLVEVSEGVIIIKSEIAGSPNLKKTKPTILALYNPGSKHRDKAFLIKFLDS
ncbi:hypothetical protein SK128_010183 [Halocaridina rubra]|uniref:Uncharacterized protein n=1 Tax=Halocaridina rubra TaxID=373956 RepID=A0AAN8X4C6_HALRR